MAGVPSVASGEAISLRLRYFIHISSLLWMEIECVVLVAMTDFFHWKYAIAKTFEKSTRVISISIIYIGYNYVRIIRLMFCQALSSCCSSFCFTRPKPQGLGIPQRARGVDNNGAYDNSSLFRLVEMVVLSMQRRQKIASSLWANGVRNFSLLLWKCHVQDVEFYQVRICR